ncbi:hypothetical protein PVAND_006387 [Polypedilum vanderplanki]|uniref:Uncharacterized protein n=1 Tax=Polypedilum vanderplanki TaxID=319348 RepID=A0A9J6C418_POLVA|nr:hypothetical protein PVAND_006387 [Polypedilum vanderplanki]
MANKSIPDIQKDLKEICEYYTKLTSLLLINGYEDFLTKLKNLSEVECLEAVTNVLDEINSFIEEEQAEEPVEDEEEDDTIMRMLLEGIEEAEVAAVAGSFHENLSNEKEDTIGTVERKRFQKIMKTSLEKSLTEKIVPAIQAVLDESLEIPDRPKIMVAEFATPPALRHLIEQRKKGELEFDDQKMIKMYQDTQKWQKQAYHQSIRPKKWNTLTYRQQQQRNFDRDFMNESLPENPAPERSAKRIIPKINVEGLNIEI